MTESRFIKSALSGRPVIASSRIDNYDGENVTFHYNRHEDEKLVVETIPVLEFIERLIRHIPEKHFKMIRYYGLYARHRESDKSLNHAITKEKHDLYLSFNRWRECILASFGYDPLKCRHSDSRITITLETVAREHTCSACGSITSRLAMYICHQLRQTVTYSYVASQTNVSSSTVARVFDRINYDKPDIPRVLSIDEFRGNTETGKYQCILVDGKKHSILDILPDRTQSHLCSYFREIPKSQRNRVEFFISDMWEQYRELAKAYFPNAILITDKYHFVRQVTWTIKNVRKRL